MKTPREFMLEDLEDELVQEEWLNYLEAMAEEKDEDNESGE
jgi:hypothetical protein